MTNLTNQLHKGFINMVISTGVTTRWDAIPGPIPEKTIAKRRAKNKAARKSRAKNR